VPVPRHPDASLLLPCVDPVLVEDPDTASDNDVAAERIRVAEAYLACKRRHADLVTFETGGTPPPALRPSPPPAAIKPSVPPTQSPTS
jgi:hypothetical protein